jgi:methyl-accepting chemotaxis protein
MYRWSAQRLGNVSVSRKLGIGFALVLLLTLLTTATGWSGIDSLIKRGDRLPARGSLPPTILNGWICRSRPPMTTAAASTT